MTAAPFTPEQAAKLAEFDAAPPLAETSPIVRAVLALIDPEEGNATGNGYNADRLFTEQQIRAALDEGLSADVLAADPEPRDAVIERMARAMWAARKTEDPWSWLNEEAQDYYRRLAAAALDASRTHP